eukprot:3490864-Rhodomonas_salina.1
MPGAGFCAEVGHGPHVGAPREGCIPYAPTRPLCYVQYRHGLAYDDTVCRPLRCQHPLGCPIVAKPCVLTGMDMNVRPFVPMNHPLCARCWDTRNTPRRRKAGQGPSALDLEAAHAHVSVSASSFSSDFFVFPCGSGRVLSPFCGVFMFGCLHVEPQTSGGVFGTEGKGGARSRCSYLIAIAVGDLQGKDISERCKIWAEPSMVAAVSARG